MHILRAAILISFLSAFPALAAGNNPKPGQWTLMDYLAQKKSVSLMDQWLGLNTSKVKLLEFYLGGGPVNYNMKTDNGTVTTKTSKHSLKYHAALYVSFIGLEADYENTNEETESYSGALGIRLLGLSNQSTNLTAKYGLRQLTDSSTDPQGLWKNQFAEGALTLYIVSFMGLQGNYRHYFPDTSSDGTDLRGSKATAGLFFDLGLLRIFGEYFQEKMEYVKTGVTTTKQRDGLEYGARLYF